MSKLLNFLPEIPVKFLCQRGKSHQQQALNLVCLDPLCRNNPLGCSVCYSQIHKYHKVVSVDKFIDQYTRNTKTSKYKSTQKVIKKHYLDVKLLIHNLKQKLNKQMTQFQKNIDLYIQNLYKKINIKSYITKATGIQLDSLKLINNADSRQFKQFLQFVLNNSLFDSHNNMISIADILKQDEERSLALLDKMTNMSDYCNDLIINMMKTLNFSEQTLKQQHVQFNKRIQNLKINKNEFDTINFGQLQELNKKIKQQIKIDSQHWRNNLVSKEQKIKQPSKQFKYIFNQRKKHQNLSIFNKGLGCVSNITALKPQYALLYPNLKTLPLQVKKWSLKIKKCRNFASENTLGIGIATSSSLQLKKYEGNSIKNLLMLTSQGYLYEKQQFKKTNVIFSEGDNLYCVYDPFYKLFQISKDNGNRLVIKMSLPEGEQIYPFVRLTYASDQVQII